jgi:hypothetical protein
MVETSGRKDGYSTVNSIGAVGAYQVMKANIPSWTKEALGHSLTWQQFRDSPSAQDQVARYKLGKTYAKYGPEGAAAVWFSGQPNPNSKASDGGNTVRQYVNKVMGFATGHKGRMPSSPAPTSPGAATPEASTGSVQTAALQQAGYDAVIDLTPWGIPLNPFKLPGWIEGQLGKAAGGAGGFAWDTLGPLVLATVGIVGGAALVITGLSAAIRPAAQSETDGATQVVKLLA